VLGYPHTPPLPPSLRELRLLEVFSRDERGIGLQKLGSEVRLVAAAEPGPLLQVCADHVSHGLSWQRQDGGAGGGEHGRVCFCRDVKSRLARTRSQCRASCLSCPAL